MGAYDGAEVCELVGTYMLNLLSKKYNKNDFGLYCDDVLAVLKNKSGPQSEQVKKNIQKIFKEHGLEILQTLRNAVFGENPSPPCNGP